MRLIIFGTAISVIIVFYFMFFKFLDGGTYPTGIVGMETNTPPLATKINSACKKGFEVYDWNPYNKNTYFVTCLNPKTFAIENKTVYFKSK